MNKDDGARKVGGKLRSSFKSGCSVHRLRKARRDADGCVH